MLPPTLTKSEVTTVFSTHHVVVDRCPILVCSDQTDPMIVVVA